MSHDAVPQQFVCPITSQIMADPVIDPEGNTFERAAILEWLAHSRTSPITRAPLSPRELAPNRALKDAIDAWKGHVVPGNGAVNACGASSQCQAAVVPPAVASPPLGVKLLADDTTGVVHLCITPAAGPEGPQQRAPIDIVCAIDVSGSMSTEAVVQNDRHEKERHGLSVLDVVKHAVRTISQMLGPSDRMALVIFSTEAGVHLPLTLMDNAGKAAVVSALDRMYAHGRTNLWEGTRLAMEQLKDGNGGRNAAVLVLTDGQPNVIPPRGNTQTLANYLAALSTPAAFTVSTFGFGYELDSAELLSLAEVGSGMFVYIPDSGLIGTVFVNFVANMLATATHTVRVDFTADPDLIDSGSLPRGFAMTAKGCSGCIGTVQYGQSRDICIALQSRRACGKMVATVDYGHGSTVTVEAANLALSSKERTDSLVQKCRAVFCSALRQLNPAAVDKAIQVISMSIPDPKPVLVKGLLEDLGGEVKLAFQSDSNWKRWGQHYLLSLCRANELQQCNNFKDHSVANYGGKLFSKLRDEGEQVFLTLPQPKPTINVEAPVSRGGRGTGGRGRGAASKPVPPPQPVSMSNYYNVGGGCVAGHCLVELVDGSSVAARDVRSGMLLAGGFPVQCVVEIALPKGSQLISFPCGLVITPYHPIRVGGKWQFPIDVAGGVSDVTTEDTSVYVFVLSGGHVAHVCGTDVVTWGHSFVEDVVRHPFFGSWLVVDALMCSPGWACGYVRVSVLRRSPVSMRVMGLELTSSAPPLAVCA